MSSIYSIYKATNTINGKVYVGFTSNWPDRIGQHKYESKNSNKAFHRALRKYGENNFDWQLIYQSKELTHTLKTMEPHFIKEYKSFGKNGYNLTEGGEGIFGYTFSEKTIESFKLKRSGSKNPMYGKKGILNPNFGKKCHTKEFKKSRSDYMKNNNPSVLYRVKCEHCQKEMSKSNHTKWHGDKCNYFLSQSSTRIR